MGDSGVNVVAIAVVGVSVNVGTGVTTVGVELLVELAELGATVVVDELVEFVGLGFDGSNSHSDKIFLVSSEEDERLGEEDVADRGLAEFVSW